MFSIGALNPDNYRVGKGKLYFMPNTVVGGDILDYPVGNVTEFELTPNLELLKHFSQMAGTKSVDKTVTLTKGYDARMVMEEWTPRNMQIMLSGPVDQSNLADVRIKIGQSANITGRLLYIGTNDVGAKWNFDLPAVEFSPSGSLNPISDEWGNMEVTGSCLVQGDGSFGDAYADFSVGAAVPTNLVPPTVYGTARVGFTLTAIKGTWTGAPTTFAYQWQHDAGAGFVDIAGKTASTYVVVVASLGFPVRVKVTATNAVGPNAGTITSPPTANVIAA